MKKTANLIRFNNDIDYFYSELLSLVNEKILKGRKKLSAGPRIFLKGAFWLILSLYFYQVALFSDIRKYEQLIFACLFGFSTFFLVVNLSHDAAHGTLFSTKKMNKISHFFIFNILGVNADLWGERHVRSHHLFPNVQGCDADIDEILIIRLSPHTKWRIFHKYQAFYAPFVYMIGTIHAILLQDFIYITKKNLANMRNLNRTPKEITSFILAKIYYFSIWIGIPIAFTNLTVAETAIGYFVVTALVSFCFIPIIATHLSVDCDFPTQDMKGVLPFTFARHQLACSLDWSPRNSVASFFYGGLNSHAAHHLFPRIAHEYYPQITPMIQKLTSKYNISYNETSFLGAIFSHFQYLHKIGQGSKTPVWSKATIERISHENQLE
ncbi:MAG: fatty acid desaturase family protein [Pseudobdellovibrionaceae bacterium]